MADMILMGKTGEVEIRPETIAALRQAYPTKDIDRELAAMHLWLWRNPGSRPVLLPRFIANWLRKAPDVIRPVPKVSVWWTDDQRTLNQGRAVGLEPRPGESMAQFRDRISAKLEQSDNVHPITRGSK